MSIIVLIITFAIPATGAELKHYVDKKEKFEVSYPDDWSIRSEEPKYAAIISNKDETVNIGIMVIKRNTNVSAREYLDDVEKVLEVNNTLTEKEQIYDKNELKLIGAEEGQKGKYIVDNSEITMTISYFVFTRTNKVFVITRTILSNLQDKHEETLKLILHSFKIIG